MIAVESYYFSDKEYEGDDGYFVAVGGEVVVEEDEGAGDEEDKESHGSEVGRNVGVFGEEDGEKEFGNEEKDGEGG